MLLDICGKYLNFTPKAFWHPGFKFQLWLLSLDPALHFNFDCRKQNANSVKWVTVAHLSGLDLSTQHADNQYVVCTSVQHSHDPWLWRRGQKQTFLDHADQGAQLCSLDTGGRHFTPRNHIRRGLYGVQLLQSTFTPFMAFISIAYSWEAKAHKGTHPRSHSYCQYGIPALYFQSQAPPRPEPRYWRFLYVHDPGRPFEGDYVVLVFWHLCLEHATHLWPIYFEKSSA